MIAELQHVYHSEAFTASVYQHALPVMDREAAGTTAGPSASTPASPAPTPSG